MLRSVLVLAVARSSFAQLFPTPPPEPATTADPEPTTTPEMGPTTPEPAKTTTPEPAPTTTTEMGSTTPVPAKTTTPEPAPTTTPESAPTTTPEPENTTTPEPVTTVTPEPAPTTTEPPEPGPVMRIQAVHAQHGSKNVCVDLPGGDTSNAALLWMWECYVGDTQRWLFEDGLLKYGPDPSKCVDLLGGDSTNGNLLGLWDCYGGDNQKWGYDSDFGTIYLASSVASDATKCMQLGDPVVPGEPSDFEGSQIMIWDCTGEEEQQWIPLSSQPPSTAVV